MAVDEALLVQAGAGPQQRWTHTLRLYRFDPPALSIGAFQSLAEVDQPACSRAGIDLVRRPTGGRAVLHDGDLIYAIAGPAVGPVFEGSIRESYRRIGAALLDAIESFGVGGLLAAPATARAANAPSCFASAAPYELLVAGAKLAGSAQIRRGGAALQHGSLRLRDGGVPIASLLRPRRGRHGPLSTAEPPTLEGLTGHSSTLDTVTAALAAAFSRQFGVLLCSGTLSQHEEDLALRLEAERYVCNGWTSQR